MLQHSVPKMSEISFTVKVGEGSSIKTTGTSKKEYFFIVNDYNRMQFIVFINIVL